MRINPIIFTISFIFVFMSGKAQSGSTTPLTYFQDTYMNDNSLHRALSFEGEQLSTHQKLTTTGEDLLRGRETATSFSEDPPTSSRSLHLFPNPVKNELSIRYASESSEPAHIQFMDLSGRILVVIPLYPVSAHMPQKISVDSFSAGMYIVKVIQGRFQMTKKVNITQ